jgi:hypothetical protein
MCRPQLRSAVRVCSPVEAPQAVFLVDSPRSRRHPLVHLQSSSPSKEALATQLAFSAACTHATLHTRRTRVVAGEEVNTGAAACVRDIANDLALHGRDVDSSSNSTAYMQTTVHPDDAVSLLNLALPLYPQGVA